jgi:hypothetical protein
MIAVRLTETLEERAKIWEEYSGDKSPQVRHNFVDYTRYHEAENIARILAEQNIDPTKLDVIDYGCCAGDQAIYFARIGCRAQPIDIDPIAVKFVLWRFKREKLNPNENMIGADLWIFGEVLEHMEDPLGMLSKCLENGVPYIFTSSYPYRSDDPKDDYWTGRDHSDEARKQQPACRKLLEENYNKFNFGGEKNLWIKK